jgi:hypothetical protein
VHKILGVLAMKCRANQLEILELVLSKVDEAEQAFLSRREDALDQAIEELRSIASTQPGNIFAATNMCTSYPEAALAILLQKKDMALKK